MYRCKQCGAAVLVVGETKVRSCAHVDAPIIASMEAVAHGRGGVR